MGKKRRFELGRSKNAGGWLKPVHVIPHCQSLRARPTHPNHPPELQDVRSLRESLEPRLSDLDAEQFGKLRDHTWAEAPSAMAGGGYESVCSRAVGLGGRARGVLGRASHRRGGAPLASQVGRGAQRDGGRKV